MQIHILNEAYFRSQLIWIYTVCKGRTYQGSAELGLRPQKVVKWTGSKFKEKYGKELKAVIYVERVYIVSP